MACVANRSGGRAQRQLNETPRGVHRGAWSCRPAGISEGGRLGYPIAVFSWITVFKNQKDPLKGRAIVDLLRYIVSDGQQYAESLSYAPLPKAIQDLPLAKRLQNL